MNIFEGDCQHEYDEEKSRILNNGVFGYGTQEYICKKCGKQYSRNDILGRISGYSGPSDYEGKQQ